jgi:hypothetical protein
VNNSPDIMKEHKGCMKNSVQRERERVNRDLQPTNRRRYFISDHIHSALSNLSTIQLHESLLSDIKSQSRSVDSNEIDRRARSSVGQIPARSAVRRVPDDVEGAAEERERRDVAERGETRRQPVRAVRARYAVHRAGLVVVGRVERRAEGWRCCGRRWLRWLWTFAGIGRGWVRLFGRVVRRGSVSWRGGSVGWLG